jgi:hypothetical protein
VRPSSGVAERLLADGLGAKRGQASAPRTAIWALRTLVTRYLHAYGPAAPQHFARWWLAIPPRSAAGLFGTLADARERVELDGQPGWTLAGGTATPPGPHRGICLLPYFDTYLVAGQPRIACTRARPTPARSPRRARPELPVLLVDGVVGGVWHQRRSGRRTSVLVAL